VRDCLEFGGSFAPEALKVIWQAVDRAWAKIEGDFGNDPRH